MRVKNIDWFMVGVYAIGLLLCGLIIALCATTMKVSSLSHDNEILVAQKEIWDKMRISCVELARESINNNNTGRFKFDPLTGSIYDNETKEIYRKVIDYKELWDDPMPSTVPIANTILRPVIETDFGRWKIECREGC